MFFSMTLNCAISEPPKSFEAKDVVLKAAIEGSEDDDGGEIKQKNDEQK